MEIIGYFKKGDKGYVGYRDKRDKSGGFLITDGFHDKDISNKNSNRMGEFKRVERSEIDVEKIKKRIRGTRPWHPLAKLAQL